MTPEPDPAGFEAVVRQCLPMVESTCRRIVGNASDADDAVQATFLALHHRWDRLGHDRSRLPAWLHQAAVWSAQGLLRSRRRRQRHERACPTTPQPEEAPMIDAADPLARHLDAAVEALPLSLRRAVVLRYLHGLSTEACAEALNCSTNAVALRLSRGLARLRAVLARRGVTCAIPALLLACTPSAAPTTGLLGRILAATADPAAIPTRVHDLHRILHRRILMRSITLPISVAVLTAVAALVLHLTGAESPPGSTVTPTAANAVGWRGDRGVFPAQGLVTSFSADASGAGKNLIWRAELPCWGANAPIVVKDRVFVMVQENAETGCPHLLCYDIHTGTLLWQKPVDHLDAWPAARQTEAKAMRRTELRRWDDHMRWWNRMYWDNAKNGWKDGATFAKKTGPPALIPQAQQDLVAEALKAGWKMAPLWAIGVSGGDRGRFGYAEAVDDALRKNCDRCIQENIYWYPGWSSEGPFWGSVMGSLVSDGTAVYAITALDGAACYELDGTRRWVADLASTWIRMRGTNCDFGSRYQQNLASPVLTEGKLLYYHRDAATLYALDATSGKVLWKTLAPMDPKNKDGYVVPRGYDGHMAPGGTPVLMDLGGTRVVVSGHGFVVRVADGAALGLIELPAPATPETAPKPGEETAAAPAKPGTVPIGCSYKSWVADGDRIWADSMRHGLVAMRLTLVGGTLKVEKLWAEKGLGDAEGPNLAFVEGRLYGVAPKDKGFSGMDPATGAIAAQGPRPAGWCAGWAISRDGVAVYRCSKAMSDKRGDTRFAICQLPEMKTLGEGSLDDTPTARQRDRNLGLLGKPTANFGPAGLTAFGNRIFIRSNHYLWCFGDTSKPFAPVP